VGLKEQAVEYPLEKYSIQDLQLEIIRRYLETKNHGAAIVDFLHENPALWISVILDNLDEVPDPEQAFHSLPDLNKLYCASRNWTDGQVLWFIVPDEHSAHELFQLGKAKGLWGLTFSKMLVFDEYTTNAALGTGRIQDKKVAAINLR
jgi:hypothetical protein